MKKWIWLIILLAGIGIVWFRHVKKTVVEVEVKVRPTVTVIPSKYAEPVAEFKKRITKKFFGTYVTPQNSPVSPERFKGYHTGVDVEYGEVVDEVKVGAIAEGKVIYSGRVNGYGGAVVIQHKDLLSLYGHVVPKTKVGEEVTKGQEIAILGKAYSEETDGERRHLHLAIIKGTKIDYRGYVQNREELSAWVDPMSLY